MQLLNILTIALLTSTTSVEPSTFIKNNDGEALDIIYEEGNTNISNTLNAGIATAEAIISDDTTSFNDAATLYPEQIYTDTFPESDQFDYYKYTATYSRVVYLTVSSEDSVVNVNVYLASKGLTLPFKTYDTTDEFTYASPVFVAQGDTIYFQVYCDLSCTYTATLSIDINPSGKSWINANKIHNYSIPHTGAATIYYSFHSSTEEYVEDQDFTFKECFLEAMNIWESCGNITFQQSLLNATCKIKVDSSISYPSVVFTENTLTGNYYVSECKIFGDLIHYKPLYEEVYYNYDGSPVTVREAVVGVCVTTIGAYIGLGVVQYNNYSNNMMSSQLRAYAALGDGDINSFMYVWGDANEN